MKFEIKNRFSGELIFTIETGSWRLAIEAAIKSNVDLSSANLLSADLSSADLRSANLSYADLSSADLRYADLRSADLSYADLSYANLRYADLSSADLRLANLSSADLSSADLRSANLSSADLRSADLLIYQFRKDWAYYTFDGMIRIGCEFHKVDTWLKDYRSIGEKNGYDKIEIEMYGKFIEMCAAHYQTLVE